MRLPLRAAVSAAAVAVLAACGGSSAEWAEPVTDTPDRLDSPLVQRLTNEPDENDRLAALRDPVPTTVQLVEPAGDPLPESAAWADAGVAERLLGGVVVLADRVEATGDELRLELRILSQRDDETLIDDWVTEVTLVTYHGFGITPISVEPSWSAPGIGNDDLLLPSGGQETMTVVFERPLVDPPVGLEIGGFDDMALSLD